MLMRTPYTFHTHGLVSCRLAAITCTSLLLYRTVPTNRLLSFAHGLHLSGVPQLEPSFNGIYIQFINVSIKYVYIYFRKWASTLTCRNFELILIFLPSEVAEVDSIVETVHWPCSRTFIPFSKHSLRGNDRDELTTHIIRWRKKRNQNESFVHVWEKDITVQLSWAEFLLCDFFRCFPILILTKESVQLNELQNDGQVTKLRSNYSFSCADKWTVFHEIV